MYYPKLCTIVNVRIHMVQNAALLQIERTRRELDSLELIWRERVQKLEQQRSEFEDETNRMRNQLVQEKLRHEEDVASIKHRMKIEEVS